MLKLAVIGDPIGHSLSPVIHQAALGRLGIACEYTARQVRKGELPQFITAAKQEGLAGFNVTMPHKLDILPYLEDCEPCESVNTVRIRKGKLYGYNTDAPGFILSLSEKGISMAGRRVLIAGAGGAARTLAAAAKGQGAVSVKLLCRKDGTLHTIEDFAPDCDLFINATPQGMTGSEAQWEDLGFVDRFPPDCVVYDLIYNPWQTKLSARAQTRGLTALSGLAMLVYQAILADEIYLS